MGLGSAHNVQKSAQVLKWEDEEHNSGHFTPYVISTISITLWGWDILSQMGILMDSPHSTVANQMLNINLNPLKGMGKDEQGIVMPIIPQSGKSRAGLGSQDL